MEVAIAKLMNTNIKIPLTYLYFNAYLMKSVYFGCGIFGLTNPQENELKRIYEEAILVKLNLRRKFPWAILYVKKSAMGIGLI